MRSTRPTAVQRGANCWVWVLRVAWRMDTIPVPMWRSGASSDQVTWSVLPKEAFATDRHVAAFARLTLEPLALPASASSYRDLADNVLTKDLRTRSHDRHTSLTRSIARGSTWRSVRAAVSSSTLRHSRAEVELQLPRPPDQRTTDRYSRVHGKAWCCA